MLDTENTQTQLLKGYIEALERKMNSFEENRKINIKVTDGWILVGEIPPFLKSCETVGRTDIVETLSRHPK